MTHAYNEIYLNQAMDTMGNMMDTAVNYYGCDADIFFNLFITSGYAVRFGRGEANIVAGRSGEELAELTLSTLSSAILKGSRLQSAGRTPEYWAGWALAYYQWETALSFKAITRRLPLVMILGFYDILHEADIEKVKTVFDSYMRHSVSSNDNIKLGTRIAEIRKSRNLTQQELAGLANINVSQVQRLETGKISSLNISLKTGLALADVLGIDAHDLIAE